MLLPPFNIYPSLQLMKIFKFGGASVSTAERIKNVAEILRNYSGEKLLVVISAMGKTTNALEKVVDAFYKGDKAEALRLFEAVKNDHLAIAAQLKTMSGKEQDGPSPLADFFTEIEWLLHDKPVRSYDYYYDQVVCIGELLSTAIVSLYLNEAGISNEWVDVRDIIRTDNNFRDARIDWKVTAEKWKMGSFLYLSKLTLFSRKASSEPPMKMKALPSAAKEAIIPQPFLPTCSMPKIKRSGRMCRV
jgi:aspartate kinase